MQHRINSVNETARTATCAVCGPGSPVSPKKNRHGNRYWRCAKKHRSYPQTRKPLTPEDYERRRARRYGISLEKFKALGTACGICGTEEDFQPLGVDHCHTTGRVRGRLCSNCNRALGLFGDDPERLRAAISYLERALAR